MPDSASINGSDMEIPCSDSLLIGVSQSHGTSDDASGLPWTYKWANLGPPIHLSRVPPYRASHSSSLHSAQGLRRLADLALGKSQLGEAFWKAS